MARERERERERGRGIVSPDDEWIVIPYRRYQAASRYDTRYTRARGLMLPRLISWSLSLSGLRLKNAVKLPRDLLRARFNYVAHPRDFTRGTKVRERSAVSLTISERSLLRSNDTIGCM